MAHIFLKDVTEGFDAPFVGNGLRHMNATCLTTAPRVPMNLLKITLLYFALFQRMTCKFCDCMRNGILRDQIVLGITDNATRKRLLQESALILTACVDGLCRCAEATSSQLRSVWVWKKRLLMPSPVTHMEDRQSPNASSVGKLILSIRDLCPASGKMLQDV